MSDSLLWGSARPRFRLSTSSTQTNGSNYILNQPPVDINISFPKETILSESVLDGHLVEDIIGYRGIFDFSWDYLDRASCERLIDIFNSSNDIYLRPYFNYYKEYKVRCSNAWELERMSSVTTQPYKGSLTFETLSLESSVPSESAGAFNFDGSTKIEKTGLNALTGNVSLELWIKTPDSVSAPQTIARLTDAAGTCNWLIQYLTDQTIRFRTDDGTTHDLVSSALNSNTWYHIIIKRVEDGTDIGLKRIYVNSSQDGAADDNKASNDITDIEIGETTNGFHGGLCQIVRLYDLDIDSKDTREDLMIEKIPSSYFSDLRLWWDFSQGSTTDLTANGNNGVVTGNEKYYEEQFTDTGMKSEGIEIYYYKSYYVKVTLSSLEKTWNYDELTDKAGNTLPSTITNAFPSYIHSAEDRDVYADSYSDTSITIKCSKAGAAEPPFDIMFTIIGEHTS